MGQAIESLQPAACRSTLSTHLDGVPSALQRAEITPVEPDPANTGVGIEMRRSIVRAVLYGSVRDSRSGSLRV